MSWAHRISNACLEEVGYKKKFLEKESRMKPKKLFARGTYILVGKASQPQG